MEKNSKRTSKTQNSVTHNVKGPVLQVALPENSNLKFALLGSGYHLCAFAQLLVEKGFPPPVIVTHPMIEHLRDKSLLTDEKLYTYLFDTAERLNLKVIETSSVNDHYVIDHLLKLGCTASFSLSCRSIIKREFIDAFSNRVFNIHPSFLPEERGGGIFSWRILNDKKDVSATIHFLDEGIDTGPIILQRKHSININKPTPKDFIIRTNELYKDLLSDFIEMIHQHNGVVSGTAQNEEMSTYLPRLFTEVNAAINWDWTLDKIELFIRAFSYPYPGAYTFVRGKRVSILEAEIHGYDKKGFHPFVSGRVIKFLYDGSIIVAVADGLLRIKKLSFEGCSCNPSEMIKITDVFQTPYEILFESRSRTVNVKEMTKVVYK